MKNRTEVTHVSFVAHKPIVSIVQQCTLTKPCSDRIYVDILRRIVFTKIYRLYDF